MLALGLCLLGFIDLNHYVHCFLFQNAMILGRDLGITVV